MKSVTRIVQEMVMNNGEPLKAIASKISKPYPTLLRELNPYDKGAKLGVETLLELMEVTQDHRPLQYMADKLGLALVPKSELPDEPRMTGVQEYAARNGAGITPMRETASLASDATWGHDVSETG